jgi:hypothetical protein
MQKPEDTTTGEVIHSCGYLHNEGTHCPPPESEDFEALKVLKKNFYCCAGVFVRKHSSYEPTKEEWVAINYLCDEWDYGYEGGWVGA